MRQAASEYLVEEARLRGARPRVKAVLYPFDLDYGLAPGSGEYLDTSYGGEPGKLALAEGYHTAASWTSPVVPAFAPYLDSVCPSWEDQAAQMDVQVYLRTGKTPLEVSGAAYTLLTPGLEFPLGPYFQLRVEFRQNIRSWAVDQSQEADEFTAYGVDSAPAGGYESYGVEGESSGCLANLCLEGRLSLPESEIIDPGAVGVDLARDFSELRAGSHILVLDHRRGQWLTRTASSYLQGLAETAKQVDLYHGWELPGGNVDWQLVYRGAWQRLTGMGHGWRERHQAQVESQDWVTSRLRQTVGAPTPEGERRPFLRGSYRARAELTDVTPATVSEPVLVGSGSATLKVMGAYRGNETQEYLLEVQNGGEVGNATCRWSLNGGQSWQDSGFQTGGGDGPVQLQAGLAVYWDSGPGTDLVAGDRWTFTATPPIYRCRVYGAPFVAITAVYCNEAQTWEGVAADPATGVILVTGRSDQVEARVTKDATTHPVDIMADILAEIGLSQAINQDSFALAKSLTPEYAIGVCFENISAAQALREIVRRCLYDLWVDFGEIKIRAYLGEDQ
ncbi:MAG: hypothetical protein NTY36_09605 [Deltaproteobacteria bacterium]|nr:hypothetical protein [Deltaproteobacteria bacterium]